MREVAQAVVDKDALVVPRLHRRTRSAVEVLQVPLVQRLRLSLAHILRHRVREVLPAFIRGKQQAAVARTSLVQVRCHRCSQRRDVPTRPVTISSR